MILLSHVEPTDNLNRWYLVSIQSTLFSPYAVIIAWGRRDNDFQQWRAIPVDTPDHAQELAVVHHNIVERSSTLTTEKTIKTS